MDARVGTNFRDNRRHAAGDDLLRIRLSRVDNVINLNAATEIRSDDLRRDFRVELGGGDPGDMRVRIGAKRFVVEIKTQPAEFPQLVGDILAGVGHRSI